MLQQQVLSVLSVLVAVWHNLHEWRTCTAVANNTCGRLYFSNRQCHFQQTEVGWFELPVIPRKYESALHRMLQFPHISRPGVLAQKRQCGRGHFLRWVGCLLTKAFQEMRGQWN